MKKILPAVFLFILSLSFSAGTAYAAIKPVPPPGLIPCSAGQQQDPNFNSSRPYQASPCGGTVTANYCSNDLNFIESFQFAHWLCQPKKITGDWDCPVNYHVPPHQLYVDLSNTMFPIMGNTEQVKNSATNVDTFDDATKMNEYVSWYLSGVNNKAEYGDTKNTSDEIINFSGPIQKIMPQAIQEAQRILTINSISINVPQDPEGGVIGPPSQPGNHNQIVVCGSPSILGIFGLVTPHECYAGGGSKAIPTAYRLNDWNDNLSVIRTAINAIGSAARSLASAVGSVVNSIPFLKNTVNGVANAAQNAIGGIPVVGSVINNIVIPSVGTIINNATCPAWNDRRPPLPWGTDPCTDQHFTPIAYEKAYMEWRGKTCAIIPIMNKLLCFDNPLVTNTWADLFPYIPLAQTVDKKGVENITGVQFLPAADTQISDEKTGLKKNAPLYFAHTQEVKDLSEFLNKSYTPKGVENVPLPDTTEKNVCSAVNVRTNPGDNLFPNVPNDPGGIEVHDVEYTIDQVVCHEVYEKYPCPNDKKKGRGGICENKSLSCPGEVTISIKTGTKTPWANEIFASTVADSGSTFRKIYPKVSPGAPVECVADIPTVTNVTYDSTRSEPPARGTQKFGVENHPSDGGATPDAPQLTFPHIGSVYEYFLKGIQTALRPKGYGDPNPISGQCQTTSSSNLNSGSTRSGSGSGRSGRGN